MCNNFPNIRITEGNNFSLVLPLRSRTYVATKPIDEDIDLALLQNIVVTFGGVEYQTQITDGGVLINLPATLAVGTYNILLTADYFDSSIRAAYESAVTIVPWSAQSTAEQYIAGSPIVLRAAYVLSGVMTDAELEQLKEELRQDIADANAAKEEAEAEKERYAEAIEHLDDIATETTASAAKTAADNAKTAADEAKEAAQAITGYALQGGDQTATNTALLNILNGIATTMYKGVPVQTQTTDATIAPNVWNVWASVAGNLTVTKGTDIADIVNDYMVRFTLASNWSGQITFSGFTLSWNGGSVPTWTAGKTYEISIVDNIALWAEI